MKATDAQGAKSVIPYWVLISIWLLVVAWAAWQVFTSHWSGYDIAVVAVVAAFIGGLYIGEKDHRRRP